MMENKLSRIRRVIWLRESAKANAHQRYITYCIFDVHLDMWQLKHEKSTDRSMRRLMTLNSGDLVKTTGGLHPVHYFEKPFPQFRLWQPRLQSLKSGAVAHQHPIRNNELQADTHRCRGEGLCLPIIFSDCVSSSSW